MGKLLELYCFTTQNTVCRLCTNWKMAKFGKYSKNVMSSFIMFVTYKFLLCVCKNHMLKSKKKMKTDKKQMNKVWLRKYLALHLYWNAAKLKHHSAWVSLIDSHDCDFDLVTIPCLRWLKSMQWQTKPTFSLSFSLFCSFIEPVDTIDTFILIAQIPTSEMMSIFASVLFAFS